MAKAAQAEKELTWEERVAQALKKIGGKGRLSEIAAATPLPKGWDPKKH